MIRAFFNGVLDSLKSKLEIHSPSRVWIDELRRKREYIKTEPLPWYSPRHPMDPWESKAKRRNARLVRRARRRESRQ